MSTWVCYVTFRDLVSNLAWPRLVSSLMEFSASPLTKSVSTSVAVAFNTSYLSVGNTDMSDALFITHSLTQSLFRGYLKVFVPKKNHLLELPEWTSATASTFSISIYYTWNAFLKFNNLRLPIHLIEVIDFICFLYNKLKRTESISITSFFCCNI